MSKVVFFGYGKLGALCLERLLKKGCEVVYVFTHRGGEEGGVESIAQKLNIPYTFDDARRQLDFYRAWIQDIEPQYIISVNYRYIIPKALYVYAAYAFNIHGALLPAYRGRTPHVWSIINGELESGVTCHLLDEVVDAGAIICQRAVQIAPEDTGYTMLKKFEKIYPTLVLEAIERLEIGASLQVQDEAQASYYGKRTPDMGYIDFRKTAAEVVNFVRAQAPPYPGAYCYLSNGRKMTIHRLEVTQASHVLPIGVVTQIGGEYFVRCTDALLKVNAFEW